MVLLFIFSTSKDELQENPLRGGAAVEVATAAAKGSFFRDQAPPAHVQEAPSQAHGRVPH
jgi:hypothetical protein